MAAKDAIPKEMTAVTSITQIAVMRLEIVVPYRALIRSCMITE